MVARWAGAVSALAAGSALGAALEPSVWIEGAGLWVNAQGCTATPPGGSPEVGLRKESQTRPAASKLLRDELQARCPERMGSPEGGVSRYTTITPGKFCVDLKWPLSEVLRLPSGKPAPPGVAFRLPGRVSLEDLGCGSLQFELEETTYPFVLGSAAGTGLVANVTLSRGVMKLNSPSPEVLEGVKAWAAGLGTGGPAVLPLAK